MTSCSAAPAPSPAAAARGESGRAQQRAGRRAVLSASQPCPAAGARQRCAAHRQPCSQAARARPCHFMPPRAAPAARWPCPALHGPALPCTCLDEEHLEEVEAHAVQVVLAIGVGPEGGGRGGGPGLWQQAAGSVRRWCSMRAFTAQSCCGGVSLSCCRFWRWWAGWVHGRAAQAEGPAAPLATQADQHPPCDPRHSLFVALPVLLVQPVHALVANHEAIQPKTCSRGGSSTAVQRRAVRKGGGGEGPAPGITGGSCPAWSYPASCTGIPPAPMHPPALSSARLLPSSPCQMTSHMLVQQVNTLPSRSHTSSPTCGQ